MKRINFISTLTIFLLICNYVKSSDFRVDSIVSYNSEGAFTGKTLYTNDVQSNTKSRIYSNWDNLNNLWSISFKIDSVFDEHNNLITDSKSIWNSLTSTWTLNYLYKYELTYNTSYQILTNTKFIWDDTNKLWKESLKHENSYDSNGNKTQVIYYTWDNTNNIWKLHVKDKYNYNIDNLVSSYLFYMWNSTDGWKLYTKEENTYNTVNNNIQTLYYSWDNSLSIWNLSAKDTFTYNINNNLILFETFKWNKTLNIWEHGNTKISYTYDSNDLILIQKYTWSNVYIDFIPLSKQEYIYNNGYYEEKGFGWDDSINDWYYNGKLKYYYSSTSTNNIENKNNNILIFPNPFTGIIYIEGSTKNTTIFLYDLEGNLILKYSMNENNFIDLENLSSGLYILVLNNESGIITKQILKK